MRKVFHNSSSLVSRHFCKHARFFSLPPTSTKEHAEKLKRLKAEAEQKGFARRENMDDIDLLLQNTKGAEVLSESGVQVANLPSKAGEVTPFDEYKHSTVEYSSRVAPHGITTPGLGAGFGIVPDKRFGFLRPPKSLQPRGGGELEPKYDENGMPIDLTLSKSELIQRRKEYLKSFQGSTMSSREHFLLVDLDFEKDSILFGDTREEFERNVNIMKKVIVAYQRWERSDNFYYYATLILKLLTIWVLMECMHQYYELHLLATHYAIFTEVTEEEIHDLATKRERDFREAEEELARHPPNFTSTMRAIIAERERIRAAEADKKKTTSESVAQTTTSTSSSPSVAEGTAEALSSNSVVQRVMGGSGPSAPGQENLQDAKDLKDVSLSPNNSIPVSEFYAKHGTRHPMDTTGEKATLELKKKQERETEMSRLQQKRKEEVSLKVKIQGMWKWCWHRASSLYLPLTKEELAQFSYAASPTSIDAVRRLRRILLPRSEDYTQIVREEMLAYKEEKNKALQHVL